MDPRELDRLLSLIPRLSNEEKTVLRYFMENMSVGSLRAVKELKSQGVREPEEIMARLIDLGLLEDVRGACYNLAGPLREYVRKRGIPRL